MICNDDYVIKSPHLISKNLVAYYEDSALAYSNASLIDIRLATVQTNQFDMHMDFLLKLLEELHCHNQYSNKKMAPATCIANLI